MNNFNSIKLVSATIIALLTLSTNFAQSFEITPSYGFQFGTKLNYGRNYIKMKDSDQFGITIGHETYNEVMAEVSYVHQGTELRIRDTNLGPNELRISDLAVDWIQIGATKYFNEEKVMPFFGGGFGLVIFSPKNENFDVVDRSLDSKTEFAFSFKTGVNIMFSEHIGLNLQGNLMFPVQWGGFYVGGGSGGISTGLSVSSTTVIGAISGGLVFRN